MAKRPCSITVTSDDSTILCADKFGDVYALPLLQPPEDDQNREEAEDDESTRQKQFVPAASVLTVHSGRNRKVLEEQMKQASQGQKKMKEPLKFKHDLLLGHVSIVTDIAFAEVNGRGYILTADRDEHVRVSRGPPQAHVIEGFCYGHEAFVNKLCLVSPDLLVSGGGDDHLFVWDWLNCKLVEKLCIRDAVLKYLKEKQLSHPKLLGDEEALRVAVSGIWKVPRPQSTVRYSTDTNTHIPADLAQKREILVACEGIPALFEFKLGDSSATSNIITLSGNPLDVAFLCSGQTTFSAVVSIDNVHLAGFTTDVREDEVSEHAGDVSWHELMQPQQGVHRLQSFLMQDDGQWAEEAMTGSVLDWFSREATSDKTRGSEGRGNGASTETAAKRLRDMLYGVENLRKRPGAED
jgi:tRNA (guanine-N(7)-)-methyltransferase subunit TRM82